MISENFYPNKLAQFDPELFLPELVKFGNSYFLDASFNVDECTTLFAKNKKFKVNSGGTELSFKFPANSQLYMKFGFNNSKVTIEYSFLMNNDFLKGFHQLQANGGGDEFIEQAALKLVNRIMSSDFKPVKRIEPIVAEKVIEQKKAKLIKKDPYPFPVKKFHKAENGGLHYFVNVEERNVCFGHQDYGSATMSASSGGSRTIGFRAFQAGEIDDWILSCFSENDLEQIKKEVQRRVEFALKSK